MRAAGLANWKYTAAHSAGRNGAGWVSVNWTSYSSTTVTSAMRLPSPSGPPKTQPHGTKVLPWSRPLYGWIGSFQRTTLNFAGSAFNGVRSGIVTPALSLEVQTDA